MGNFAGANREPTCCGCTSCRDEPMPASRADSLPNPHGIKDLHLTRIVVQSCPLARPSQRLELNLSNPISICPNGSDDIQSACATRGIARRCCRLRLARSGQGKARCSPPRRTPVYRYAQGIPMPGPSPIFRLSLSPGIRFPVALWPCVSAVAPSEGQVLS